jgi:putative membrane protein
MRNFVIRLFVNALALSAAAYLVPGIHLTGGFWDVMVVALVFGLVNALLKPLVWILSMPFLLLTLGLFAFVVNGVMLLVTARLTDHLAVSGLWAAVLGSVVISLVTMVLGGALKDQKKGR